MKILRYYDEDKKNNKENKKNESKIKRNRKKVPKQMFNNNNK